MSLPSRHLSGVTIRAVTLLYSTQIGVPCQQWGLVQSLIWRSPYTWREGKVSFLVKTILTSGVGLAAAVSGNVSAKQLPRVSVVQLHGNTRRGVAMAPKENRFEADRARFALGRQHVES